MSKFSDSFDFTVYGDDVSPETGLIVISQLAEDGRKIALIDVDDVLRDTQARQKYLPTTEEIVAQGKFPNRAFHKFNSSGAFDPLIHKNFDVVRGLANSGYVVVFLTSCTYSVENKEILQAQLKTAGISSNHILVMRGADNQEQPTHMKVVFLEKTGLLSFPFNIIALDDNVQTCKKFKELGIHTLNFLK